MHVPAGTPVGTPVSLLSPARELTRPWAAPAGEQGGSVISFPELRKSSVEIPVFTCLLDLELGVMVPPPHYLQSVSHALF